MHGTLHSTLVTYNPQYVGEVYESPRDGLDVLLAHLSSNPQTQEHGNENHKHLEEVPQYSPIGGGEGGSTVKSLVL